MLLHRLFALCSIASFVAACGGDDENTVPPPPPGPALTQPLACYMGETKVDCDLSCVGTNTDPVRVESASYRYTGVVGDFFNQAPIAGAVVEMWLDQDPNKAPVATSTPTGPDGKYTLTLNNVPGNVRGIFKVSNANPDYTDTYAFLQSVSATGAPDRNQIGVRDLTVTLILGLFNITADPQATHIAGGANDCSGNALANGIVRLYAEPHECGGAGTELAGTIGYFDGKSFPDPNQRALNKDGLWLAANLTASGVVAEIYGLRTQGGTAELLGCGRMKLVPGSISLVATNPSLAFR
jgi:hypothetical protein